MQKTEHNDKVKSIQNIYSMAIDTANDAWALINASTNLSENDKEELMSSVISSENLSKEIADFAYEHNLMINCYRSDRQQEDYDEGLANFQLTGKI